MKRTNRGYFYFAFCILAVVSSVLITVRVTRVDMPMLDRWATPVVADIDHTRFFYVFRWITELGSGTFITPLTIVMAILIWHYSKDWFAGLMIALGTLLGYQVNFLLKAVFVRERPRILEEAEGIGYSFPSGHAMGAMIAYGLYVYFLTYYTKSRQIAVTITLIGIVIILLIGFSRYVIRVHYLTDVLGGFAFGYLFLMGWIALYHVLKK